MKMAMQLPQYHQDGVANKKRFNKSFHHVGLVIITISGLVLGGMFYVRNTLPIAMLEMVNRTYLVTSVYPNSTTNVLGPDYVERGEFNWSNEMQQIILLIYMISYTLLQLPMTKISIKYGLRNTVTLWVFIMGMSSLLVPWLARLDWKWMLVLRLCQGLGAAPLMPALMAAIEIWIPKEHCASALAFQQFVYIAIYIFIPLISGYLAGIYWEWCFYATALFCFLLALIWWLVSRDSPASCPFISQKELDKISENNSIKENLGTSDTLPWHFMFRIPSFYFFTITYSMFTCINNSMVHLLPTYFHTVMQFSTKQNGFFNFLIQIGLLFSVIWPQPLIIALQKYCRLSLTGSRRVVVLLYSTVGFLTQGYIAAYHQHQIEALALFKLVLKASQLMIMVTLMSQFGQSGTSGLVFSMVSAIGNLVASAVAWLAGFYLDSTGESIECWSCIFWCFAATNPIMLLAYWFYLKSEPVQLETK